MSHWFDRVFRRRAAAFRRIGDALAAQDARLDEISARLEALHADVGTTFGESVAVHRNVVDARRELAALADALTSETLKSDDRDQRLRRVLFGIRAQDAPNRERLHALRQTSEYRAAFVGENQLVSILIPTYDRLASLVSRSLPSVLAQTHENVEVLVIGDGSPTDLQVAMREHDDPRVRYIHLPVRGPYPDSAEALWHVKGSPGINAGLLNARGSWICFFADDDVMRPDAVANMLDYARTERLEFAYGKTLLHWNDGREQVIGAFPPTYGGQGLQGAVLHSGLRFVQHDYTDADFELPNDWSFMYRLMRLGARIGFADTVLADWFDRGAQPAA